MKRMISTGHKSRWVTFVTCLVVVGVLLCNVGVSVLFGKLLLQSDMTSLRYRSNAGGTGTWIGTGLYSLVDDTENLLAAVLESANEGRKEPVKVELLFCADPDLLMENETMRPIYYTAKLLERKFPESISVRTTDVWSNPSSVDAFRTTSYSSIYKTSVIISSGSEFRIRSPRAFYTFESATETTPWAYSGEKAFVKDILAVTRTESPVCCLTTNHGEPFATESGKASYSAFVQTLENAGYEVRFLDLSKEEIPEDCRLVVTLDPQTDFSNDPGDPASSEVKKLDAFLEKTYSFLAFADADTPYLPNLEEYLEEWGIRLNRTADLEDAYRANDPAGDLGKNGDRFSAVYAEAGVGASLLSELRTAGRPKAVFENAASILYSSAYEVTYVLEDAEAGTPAFSYGSYFSNGNDREVFDLFYTSESATAFAEADGDTLTMTSSPFRLAVLSMESRTVSEGQGYTNVNEASYVCAFSSTAFASNEFLSTNAYGNTDVLLAILRGIGQELLPVGIGFKALYEDEFGTNSETGVSYGQSVAFGPVGQTVILTLLPAIAFAAVGCVLLVRRKRRG